MRAKFPVNLNLYLIEATLVAAAMLAACAFGVLVLHPSSPLARSIESPLARRATLALLASAFGLILANTPLGRRTGPHLNPAMTLTFLRLGRINIRDAFGFIIGQFVGGILGVLLAWLLLGAPARDNNFSTTTPGPFSLMTAWLAEFVVSLLIVAVVFTSNRSRFVRFTSVISAMLGWSIATFESPISGAGLNAARTFAPALFSHIWHGWWIYFTAPPLGMLAAVELLRLLGRDERTLCSKLTHGENCYFKCDCLRPASTPADKKVYLATEEPPCALPSLPD